MNVRTKILGIAGSPRRGNTDVLVKEALKGAEEVDGVAAEFMSLAELDIKGGCKACYSCKKPFSMELMCRGYRDDVNQIFRKIIEADGIILGSPVYWGGPSGLLKAVLDRSMSVEDDFPFRNKVGGVVVVSSSVHGGHEGAIEDIHKWFFIHDMIVVAVGDHPEREEGGYYGAMATTIDKRGQHVPGISSAKMQAVKNDRIGMMAASALGRRVAEIAKILQIGYTNIKEKH